MYTYRFEEVVAIPVPRLEQFGAVALALGPCIAVCDRRVDSKYCNGDGKESNSCSLANGGILPQTEYVEPVADEIIHLTQSHDGKVEGREVVVEEQLTRHEVEGEVVESPAKKGHADLIIEALEGGVGVVAVATLPSKDRNSLDDHVESNDD